jgi:hypothetical protein
MAVKNSSCESAKLLLERGAHIEAKANVGSVYLVLLFFLSRIICGYSYLICFNSLLQNGMAPLHLAVWHALQSGDCSTVSVLLSYNADCYAKDDV